MRKNIIIIICFFSLPLFSQKGVVSDVTITGLKKINLAFAQRLIQVSEGEDLDSLLIQKDIQKLNHLVAVANVTSQIKRTGDSTYHVIYHIVENFTLIPHINIWTIDRLLSYSLGLYEYNLFGRNIQLGGFYQNNGFHSYGLNFRAPYLFSSQLGMAINFRNWTSKEPLYFNDNIANYQYNNESYELMGLYELDVNNLFELGGSFFKERYNYLGGADFITERIIPFAVEKNKFMLKLAYKYEQIKYDYYLLSGIKSQFYFQAIITENDLQNRFLIAWNDLHIYQRIGLKGNLATRLRLGLATNNNSPFAPFAVDNNLNIRGVGNTIDRGSGSIVWNIEYRHTLIEKKGFVLQSNVFIDAGTWRNPGGDLNDFTKRHNMKIYPGVGLRFIHKKIYNAVFRIDYGHDISQEGSGGIVLGIGQYF